jgi:hypothetical protein
MSVNSESHVLGLWIGGGVTPAALRELESAIRYHLELKNEHGHGAWHLPGPVVTELENIANACHAQLSKLAEPPKPDWSKYL